MSPVLSLAFGVLVLAFLRQWLWPQRPEIPKGLRELPGPKGLPLLGNISSIPAIHAFLTFYNLSKAYGPIYKLSIFGSTHVIISSSKIAEDLLAKRGAIYSDRGHLHMLNLITRGGDLLASSTDESKPGPDEHGAGGYWRRGRRFTAAMMAPSRAGVWEPFQRETAIKLVLDMVRDPEEYRYWFDRFAASVGLRQVYGVVPPSEEETKSHTVKIAERMHHIERVATPGGYLVELLPTLMYLPEWAAPFKREARALHEIENAYFTELLGNARKKLQAGVAENPPSFARTLLSDLDKWELSEPEVKYVLGTVYGGGSGTTANAMGTFMLAMVHYPDWQRAMQDEIDSVVGSDRVPGFEDSASLPLVRAVVKETLRWRPVIAGNIPHRLTQDDSYMGYHIPAGSFIHGNQWAIHRDETLYPDPESFNPARFLESEYATYKEPLETYPNIKRFSAFGFGRRICPGLETAERSLFIQILLLAWTCRIGKRVGADGEEIHIPWFDYTTGSNIMPNKFEFSLVARDEGRMNLLRGCLGKV
ncbi:cytochrome P450 [Aspergillus venezuelensis]